MKNNIIIYVNAEDVCPSGYYRILQFVDRDSATVHSLMPPSVFVSWHKSNAIIKKLLSPLVYLLVCARVLFYLCKDNSTLRHQSGKIIISRAICPHYIPFIHCALLRKLSEKAELIWDFDDNILNSKTISSREFILLSEISSKIIVTGEFLKNLVPEKYRNKVEILPTTDGDMVKIPYSEIQALRQSSFNEVFTIAWIATAGNLVHLNKVISAMDLFAMEMKEKNVSVKLDIVCNKPFIYDGKELIVENHDWSRQTVIEELKKAHVGIMPLYDTEFSKGKGGFKLIQYMSIYLPVIASNVGYNKVVVDETCGYLLDDENSQECWIESLLDLSSSYELYETKCKNARKKYDECFSFDNNLHAWTKILENENCILR